MQLKKIKRKWEFHHTDSTRLHGKQISCNKIVWKSFSWKRIPRDYHCTDRIKAKALRETLEMLSSYSSHSIPRCFQNHVRSQSQTTLDSTLFPRVRPTRLDVHEHLGWAPCQKLGERLAAGALPMGRFWNSYCKPLTGKLGKKPKCLPVKHSSMHSCSPVWAICPAPCSTVISSPVFFILVGLCLCSWESKPHIGGFEEETGTSGPVFGVCRLEQAETSVQARSSKSVPETDS